jgi:hypothetical protein
LLLEVVIAGILLATVAATALPALSWVLRERKATHRQQDAIQEVHNQLERITALPWNEITDENLAAMRPSDDVGRQLPGAELRIAVAADAGQPGGKRVTVALTWAQGRERPEASVSATAWVYRRGSEP